MVPKLFLRRFQLLPQLPQLGFQVAPVTANLRRLLLDPFAAPGLLGQRFRQLLHLLLDLRLRRLQFFDASFELGLFLEGTLLPRH